MRSPDGLVVRCCGGWCAAGGVEARVSRLAAGPTPRRQVRQAAPGRDGVGVVGAEDALADGEGALEWAVLTQRLALRMANRTGGTAGRRN